MGRILAVQIGAKVNSGNLRIALQRETVNISMSTQSQIICKHWDTATNTVITKIDLTNQFLAGTNILFTKCVHE